MKYGVMLVGKSGSVFH